MKQLLRQIPGLGEAILGALPDLMFVLDSKGTYIGFQPSQFIRPLVGPQDFLGKRTWDVLPADVASAVDAAIHKALSTRQVQSFDYELEGYDDMNAFRCRIAPFRENLVLAVVSDISELKAMQQKLLRRERILSAISFGAERFLRDGGYQPQDIVDLLARVGRAAEVDRTYVFEYYLDGQGNRLARMSYEWVGDGVSPQIETEFLQAIRTWEPPYDRWFNGFDRGEFMHSRVADLPEDERPPLEAQQIHSLVLSPIFVDGEPFGCIGLDDCTSERDWSREELEALRTAGNIIGAAIANTRAREEIEASLSRLRESEEKYRLLFESKTGAILLFTALDGIVQDVNETCLDMFGIARDEFVGRSLFSEIFCDATGLTAVGVDWSHCESSVATFTRRDGTALSAEISIDAFDWRGRSMRVAILKDITHRLEAEREASRKREQLAAIKTAEAILLAQTELDVKLQDALQVTGQVLEVDAAFVDRLDLDPATGGSVPVQAARYDSEAMRSSSAALALPFLCVRTALHGIHPGPEVGPMIGRVADLHISEQTRKLWLGEGIGRVALYPISFHGTRWGWMAYVDRRRLEWTTAELFLMSSVAQSIQSAIERSELEAWLKYRREVILEIGASEDFARACDLCLQKLSGLTRYESAAFLLVSEQDQKIQLQNVHGCGPTDVALFTPYIEANIEAATPDSSIIPFTEAASAGFGSNGIRSAYWIPLVHGGTAYAAIVLYSKTVPGFSAWMQEFMRLFVHAIAGSLHSLLSLQRLKQSQRELQSLFDAVDDMIITISTDGRIVKVNRAATDRLLYTEDQLLGMSIEELHEPSPKQLIADDVRRAIQLGSWYGEYFLIRADGVKVPAEVRITACQLDQKPVLVGVARDVTKRLEDESRLRLLGRAVDESITGIAVASMSGSSEKVILCNRAMDEIAGRSLDKATVHELLSALGITEDSNEALLRQFRSDCEKVQFTSWVRRGLRDLWLDIEVTPILTQEGSRESLLFVARDVSLIKQAEAELKVALSTEKELSDLKTRFISMASHNFRTPLAVILSSAELLERYWSNWDESRRGKHLGQIQDSVDHLQQMMTDVLFLGKVDSNSISIRPQQLEMATFLEALLERMSPAWNALSRCRFPRGSEPVNIETDPTLLHQVLENLISNALKYSPEDSDVHLSIVRACDQICVKVQDQGIGIPEADKSRLMEAFHRGKNVGNVHGSGLGMAIVGKALDLMGGTLEIDSRENSGTCATVCFPISPKARSTS